MPVVNIGWAGMHHDLGEVAPPSSLKPTYDHFVPMFATEEHGKQFARLDVLVAWCVHAEGVGGSAQYVWITAVTATNDRKYLQVNNTQTNTVWKSFNSIAQGLLVNVQSSVCLRLWHFIKPAVSTPNKSHKYHDPRNVWDWWKIPGSVYILYYIYIYI